MWSAVMPRNSMPLPGQSCAELPGTKSKCQRRRSWWQAWSSAPDWRTPSSSAEVIGSRKGGTIPKSSTTGARPIFRNAFANPQSFYVVVNLRNTYMSPTPPRPDLPDLAPTVHQEVGRLAAAPEVRSAFNWFRTQEPQLAHWQMEMARIPAPPFGESARGAWLAARLCGSGF